MRKNDLVKAVCLSWAILGCGGSDSGPKLQDPCVRSQGNFTPKLQDGEKCYNIGYNRCSGFASDCIHFCAHDVCQPQECLSSEECVTRLGPAHECIEYIVSEKSYGKWCKVSDCPQGNLGCPCFQGSTCGRDPYGSKLMSCTNGFCVSACPSSCRSGTSLCCGGAFCSGDCIGTSCC